MRIGSAPPSFRQTARSAQLNTVSGNAPNFSGRSNIGESLQQGSRALYGAAAANYEEDQRKKDFEAQKEYYRVVGETQRQQAELFQSAPANGDGVVKGSAELWEKNFSAFLGTLDPELQERYAASGESVKQDYLARAETQQRAALRGDAMFTLDTFRKEATSRLIADPDSRYALEDQYASLTASAPGLTAAERREFAQQGLNAFAAGAAEGALFRTNQQRFVDPSGQVFEAALVPAVMSAESAGRADAVSPAGAVGLMQVMPGTARGIARELGDEAFPHDFTDAEVTEYLKDPKVSMRYGKYYLRQQLITFGGDLEAALIAYNAGPGNARRWLDAGRNYAALPKPEETQPYVQRIFGKMGIVSEAEILSDPDLSADAKLAAVSRARQQSVEAQAEAARQIRAQQEARLTRLNVEIDQGLGLQAIKRAVENGVLRPGTDEFDAAIKRREKVDAEAIAVTQAVQRLSDPNRTFDPTKESRDTLALVAQHANMVAPLAARDMDAFAEGALPLWKQTGIAPTNVKEQLTLMAQSLDPRDAMFAYDALQTMLTTQPDAFVREFGDDLTDRLGAYSRLRSAQFKDEEIAMLMSQRRTPEQMGQIKAAEDAATKYLKEDFSLDSLRNSFSEYGAGIGLGIEAVLGDNILQSAQAAQLMGEYSTLYKMLYPLYQDESATDKAVVESISRRYGTMSDGTLVKYPPEKYVPAFDGGHAWVEEQFRREAGIVEGETVRWMTSPSSDSRVRAGLTPGYNFVVIRDGVIVDGGEFIPDIGQERTYREELVKKFGADPTVTARELQTLVDRGNKLAGYAQEYVNSDDEAYKAQLRTFIADLEKQMPDEPMNRQAPGDPFFPRLLDDILGRRPLAPEFMQMLRNASPKKGTTNANP